jgi:hypothetical protein
MSNIFNGTLPALKVTLGSGMAALGVIEAPSLTCSISTRVSMTMVAQLPWPPTSVGSFQGFKAGLTLPAVKGGTISGTVPNVLRVAASLPHLTAGTISGTIAGSTAGVGTLPLPTVVMRRGSALAPVLPALTGSAHAIPNLHLSFSVKLPSLDGAAAGTNAQHVIHAPLLILPKLAGLSGHIGAAITLPALHGGATIVAGTQAVRQAWAMNIKNSAVTEFTNFPFRAFARAYERYYGVGLDGGFHRFGGDLDVAAPISWEWRTGLSDLNSRAGKGVLALYLDGVAETGCEFMVETDRGTFWYTHRPHGTANDHQTQRVMIGKQLRSVNWAFGMRSTKGAYFEIDALAPEYQISDRNLF